jgi:hypothetical protein
MGNKGMKGSGGAMQNDKMQNGTMQNGASGNKMHNGGAGK